MRFVFGLLSLTAVACVDAQALEVPKNIPPQIRSACEQDVRRLCVTPQATIKSVKACVREKFYQLNGLCKLRLVQAGFSA